MMAAAIDEPDARPGMVAVIQTFGSSLNRPQPASTGSPFRNSASPPFPVAFSERLKSLSPIRFQRNDEVVLERILRHRGDQLLGLVSNPAIARAEIPDGGSLDFGKIGVQLGRPRDVNLHGLLDAVGDVGGAPAKLCKQD